MTFRTLAITLTKKPWREADSLYSFYTREMGKVVAICQGARKIQSKLNAHLEPFGAADILVASGKNFDRVAGAARVKYFFGISASIEKAFAAARVLHFLDAFIKPGVRDERIFSVLANFLNAVDVLEDNDLNNSLISSLRGGYKADEAISSLKQWDCHGLDFPRFCSRQVARPRNDDFGFKIRNNSLNRLSAAVYLKLFYFLGYAPEFNEKNFYLTEAAHFTRFLLVNDFSKALAPRVSEAALKESLRFIKNHAETHFDRVSNLF